MRVIAAGVLILLFWLVSRKLRLVPGRAQNMVEMILDFVRIQIAESVLGKAASRRYLPVLTIIFLSVLAMNITGIVPFLNIAGSSVVGVPIVLAVIAYVTFIGAGIKAQGGGKFLKNTLFPPGIPWPIYIILTPVEFISTFIVRPASLTIRLLANMIVGHLLIVTFFEMTSFLFLEASGAVKAVGLLSFTGAFAFTLFEIFVAALQAYIFTLLTAVYISMSREAEH